MVDNVSLLIAHGLLLFTAWRLLARPELDDERADTKTKAGWGRARDTDPDA